MAMTVISANGEGLTASKASILSVMCKEQHCHCLCLQETHRSKDQARPRIPGMSLVAERPHNKHGSSVFIRNGLNVNNISVYEEDNVELITVELPGVVVHSMYKPPPERFRLPALGQRNKPHIYNNRRFQQSQYTLGIHHNKQRCRICGAMGGLKTVCHSYTTRNYRNYSKKQYGRRETTRISSLYLQTCRICVKNRFWIPSRAHSILYV